VLCAPISFSSHILLFFVLVSLAKICVVCCILFAPAVDCILYQTIPCYPSSFTHIPVCHLLCFSFLLICCHCISRPKFIFSTFSSSVQALCNFFQFSYRTLSLCSCSFHFLIRCFMQAVIPDNCVIFSFLSDFGIYVPQDSFDIEWNCIVLNLTELTAYPFPPAYPLLVRVYL
jgi:hypothetical protein